MKRKTVTLLPFAPQQQSSPASTSQRSTIHSRLPSLFNASIHYIMSSSSPIQLFDTSHRPNTLRVSPSIISEASSDSSSTSSTSSSLPNTSPTSSSSPPSSLPPSPPPLPSSNRSPGKSRPLPQPPAPPERPINAPGQSRSRSPPPAWSPPETPIPTPRPTRPRLMLPPPPTSSQSPEPSLPRHPPQISFASLDGSVSSPDHLRVRPLPMRPVPPGPPSEANTPIALLGLPRWQSDGLTNSQDDIPSPYDDRRAIDWDLIDEVMKRAS